MAALTTAIFPCVTFGQIADVLDNGHTSNFTKPSSLDFLLSSYYIFGYFSFPKFPYCSLCYQWHHLCFRCLSVIWPYRRKLRQRFGLMEAPASDCMVHCLFEPCALCQEYRELKNRGINPALGKLLHFTYLFNFSKHIDLQWLFAYMLVSAI